jgi:regulator of sirC expression with transglutaminase-like and TPR domain
MQSTREIDALLKLLDDPDQEVYTAISAKILDFGKDIIPNLETLWENTADSKVQERIENIIHKVNYNDIYKGFQKWFKQDRPDLMEGAILLARYRYPDVDETEIRRTFKNIYQSCWLEMTPYLTPLEQVNILNSIFYNMYKFKGVDLDENKTNLFFLNEVMQNKSGNIYSLSLIYQLLCEKLDLSVITIQLPRQYLLAYFGHHTDFFDKFPRTVIQFYIDPNNGTIYSQNDVEAYLKKYQLESNDDHFKPLSHQQIMLSHMEALATAYEQNNEEEKMNEIMDLYELGHLNP